MLRTLAIASVLLFASCAPAPTQTDHSKEIFVVFTMPGCGPCEVLKKSLQDPRVKAKIAEFDYFCMLNQRSVHARNYRIAAYPTMLILDQDGNEKRRYTGALYAEPLLVWLR